jgi:hypothetical protein
MSEMQILTVALANIPTIVVVGIGILISNNRLNDIRDVLRAEAAKNQSELLIKLAQMEHRIETLEQQRWKP